MGLVLLVGLVAGTGCSERSRASRDASAGIAPTPEQESRAVAQVYCARTKGWRGLFAVHCWLAYKPAGGSEYVVLDVMGYRRRGREVVRRRVDLPDRAWYGSAPRLIQELRGEAAERAIAGIERGVASYPYPSDYRAWPGPNSNTFVSHVLRQVPEFSIELPPTAIGKDWLEGGGFVAWTESGSGVQLCVLGALGVTLGLAEGLEINLLGLTFGVDVLAPALKLPMIGRIGFGDWPLPWRPD